MPTIDMSSCACCGTSACGCTGIPSTLHATITLGGARNGTYVLTYVPADGFAWELGAAFGTCANFRLFCSSGAWELDRKTGLGWSPIADTGLTTTCSPLDFVFTGVSLSLCGGSNGAKVEITL